MRETDAASAGRRKVVLLGWGYDPDKVANTELWKTYYIVPLIQQKVTQRQIKYRNQTRRNSKNVCALVQH